ncbi:hypothetical protein TCAL_17118 [Tigriopus californicus]|uniref:Uncharacterized protein n=1 Tax=Tigriopus californicus TaxID=6832 RepID=A0A553P4S6_TIGCA|nr:hypothetical protein TCAL_17118 [Tigriopus californicus]
MLCSSPGLDHLGGDLKYANDCYPSKLSDMHRAEGVSHALNTTDNQEHVPKEVLCELDSLARKCTKAMDTFQADLATIEVTDPNLGDIDVPTLD